LKKYPGKFKQKMEKLIITPKTKIHDLLEAYPDLEEELIRIAPTFKKLKNPVLRRTVARVTNLRQAATVAGLNVEELVNALRQKSGQDSISGFDNENQYNTTVPNWFSATKITETLDIREMLQEGEQPVHPVLTAAKKLGDDDILEVIAPFLPAPLIDKATGLGYRHWIMENDTDEFRVYLTKS